MEEYATLLLTFVSSVIGGLAVVIAQSFYTRRLDAEQRTNEARNQCYADYLRAVAEAALHRGSTDGKISIADAKARIAVYGSVSAVHTMSKFEEAGSDLRSLDGRHAFLGIVRAMRSDAYSAHDAAVERSLKNMLFGLMEDETDSS